MDKLNSLSQENKDLLNLEKWDELFRSGDSHSLEEEMNTLSDAMREIKSEVLYLMKLKEFKLR